MAIFQLEIADADVQRVFDAICSNYSRPSSIVNPDYSEVLDADGNPTTDGSGTAASDCSDEHCLTEL